LLPSLPCHEVALIDKAKHINILLQKEYIFGLVGMGGIRKTTLRKKFYHLFHNQYDKSSFLEDVKSNNINDVIKQLIYDLVVEAHKHLNQRSRNDLDDEVHKCCNTFLNNVKGVIFYGVPHDGGPQNSSNYFTWQHQQINTLSKYATQYGILKNFKSFNTQMEHLSTNF